MLQLTSVFASHALFQHSAPLRIRGIADATVCAEIRQESKVLAAGHATPDQNGYFEISVMTPSASFMPCTMAVTTEKDSILLTDILFGELWIAGGQSNMELPNGEHPDYEQHRPDFIAAGIRAYHPYPFSFDDPMPRTPELMGEGSWLSPAQEGFADVSALASVFAGRIREELNLPVGFLNLNRGGSRLETWLPDRVRDGALNDYLEKIGRLPTDENWNSFSDRPLLADKNFQQFSAYYNRAVAPLAGISVRGVLWYQGESNCAEHCKHNSYPTLLKLLRTSWREDFGIPGEPFPFYVSTLVPYNAGDTTTLMRGRFNVALIDLAKQYPADYHVIPNADLSPAWAVHTKNHPVHPVHKYVLGERFSRMVLASFYRHGNPADAQAATLAHVERANGALTLRFNNVGSGLTIQGEAPRGLYVADSKGHYLPARCEILAPDILRLWHPGIPTPQDAAYAMVAAETRCNLFAGSYPVQPFITAPADTLGQQAIQKRPWCDLTLDGDLRYNSAVDTYRRAIFTPIPGSGCCYDTDYALGTRSLRVYAEGEENTFGVRIASYACARLDLESYAALRMSVFPLRCLEAELHLFLSDESKITVKAPAGTPLSTLEWGEIEFPLPSIDDGVTIKAMEWIFRRTPGVPFGILNIAQEAAGINLDNIYLVP
jgi:sialate O-acetylesterase